MGAPSLAGVVGSTAVKAVAAVGGEAEILGATYIHPQSIALGVAMI